MTPTALRTIRAGLGLTQGQFARLVGVEPRTWRHWEGGDRPIPEPVARFVLLAHDSAEVREKLSSRG